MFEGKIGNAMSAAFCNLSGNNHIYIFDFGIPSFAAPMRSDPDVVPLVSEHFGKQ
jgi:hypothetical protein